MPYYQLLDLQREPFANSPDPRLLYLSAQHHECLQQLELAVRLRRGLSVVIGEVGTGKTTICRRLIRNLGGEGSRRVISRLFLDPDFKSGHDFLVAIARACGLGDDEDLSRWDERQLRELFNHFLLRESVEGDRNVLLIIDEGQKLPDFCLEVLRELLNYETNDCKLVQVLIFAQEEFKEQIRRHDYFRDRIAFFFHLRPLGFGETRALINFRLRQCQRRAAPDGCRWRRRRWRRARDLFTLPALWAIYRHTGGYPRRIIMLCSQILLAHIARCGDNPDAGPRIRSSLVRVCARRVLG